MDKVYLSKNSDVLDNNMYPMTARYQQVFPGSAKLTVDDKMNACVMQYYNGGKFPIDNKESIYTAFTEVFPLEGGGAQVYCRPNPNNGNYYTQDWAGNPETYWNPGNSAKLNNRDRHIIRHSNGNYYYVNNQFEESRNYGNLGAITLSGAQYGAAGE
jgi:hypothetical protein